MSQSPQSITYEGWGIEAIHIERFNTGESTVNWKVESPEGTYVLRNAGAYGEYVRMQADLLGQLDSNGFPFDVPVPILKIDEGGTVLDVNHEFYIMYPYIEGQTGVYDGFDLQAYGAMLAAYHQSSAGFPWGLYEQRRSKQLSNLAAITPFIDDLEHALDVSPELHHAFRQEYGQPKDLKINIAEACNQLACLGIGENQQMLCHGDYSPDNIVSRSGRIVGLIDFGGVTVDPAVTDLAISISRVAISNGKYDQSVALDVLDGYLTEYAASEVDEKAIIPLAFADTVRSLAWQAMEITFNPETRVQFDNAVEYMRRAAILRDTRFHGGNI